MIPPPAHTHPHTHIHTFRTIAPEDRPAAFYQGLAVKFTPLERSTAVFKVRTSCVLRRASRRRRRSPPVDRRRVCLFACLLLARPRRKCREF